MKIQYNPILTSIINPVVFSKVSTAKVLGEGNQFKINSSLNTTGKRNKFQIARIGIRSVVAHNLRWQRQHLGNYVTDQMGLPSMWIAL